MNWTLERTAKLKALWASHHSAGQIARLMGGTTRNAVIGKARRLGLPAQARVPAAAAAWTKAKAPAKPRLVVPSPPRLREAPLPQHDEPAPLVARLERLQPGHCRWPIGDPEEPDFGFCGRLRAGEGPYCAAHRARAYPPFRPGQPSTGEELIRALRRVLDRAA